MVTASEAFREPVDPKHNSLNVLRLALAAAVIVSHAPRPQGQPSPLIGDLEVGGWAVAGFFAISGYLVTRSRMRLPLGRYLWHRSLRIFPGFWACLVVVGFGFASVAALTTDGSWNPFDGVRYVLTNITMHIEEPTVGDSLAAAEMPNWNLSLWTLEYEFLCYAAMGLLLCWTVARAQRSLTLAAFVLTVAANAAAELSHAAPDAIVGGLRLASFFLAGAVLYRFAVPLVHRFAALAVVVLAVLAITGLVRELGALPLGYLVLWLGAHLPLQGWFRRTDISYGVYVYAFPVQQLLTLWALPELGLAVYLATTIAIVVPLAWLSWTFVEKPALRARSARPPWQRGEPVAPTAADSLTTGPRDQDRSAQPR